MERCYCLHFSGPWKAVTACFFFVKNKSQLASLRFSRIPAKAKLSTQYRNHCVHATCIIRLAEAGVVDSTIMSVSEHKCVKSIQNYSHTTEFVIQRTSCILDCELRKDLDMQSNHQLGDCFSKAAVTLREPATAPSSSSRERKATQ